jgi:NAD(P)H dehydrogenase (quinone)
MSIAVTGARGNIGSKVVQLIANNKDIDVVAVVRRPIGIENLPLNVRPIVADYGKPRDLREAFAGIVTLVLITSDGDSASVLTHHRNIIAAAVQTGVSNVVALSSLDADITSPFCYAKTSAFTERMLIETGLSVSIARASIFAEFFKQWPHAARETGELRLPAADGRISLVGRDDVARCLASLAIDSQTGIYGITGPDSLDLATVAELASWKFGTPVKYTDIAPHEHVVEMTKGGLNPWWVYAYSSMFQSIREHRWASISDEVSRLTGRSPTPFGEFLGEAEAK